MSEQTLTVKRFGLSAADLRAKREAKRQARAEQERQAEITALVERVQQQLDWTDPIEFLEETKRNVWFLHQEIHNPRRERDLATQKWCIDWIAHNHRPMIEQARKDYNIAMEQAFYALAACARVAYTDISGTAKKRRLKREIKEQKRQARWMGK